MRREEKALDAVDESMGVFPVAEVLRCINIGLLCVQERAEDRPTTSSILLMLGNDKIYLSQPKQPGFVIERDPCETDPSSSKQTSLSINYVSITTLEVR